jgi:hypothetical protein
VESYGPFASIAHFNPAADIDTRRSCIRLSFYATALKRLFNFRLKSSQYLYRFQILRQHALQSAIHQKQE